MKNILILIVTLTASNILIAGGPWPQKKGEGYFKVYQWWTTFDQHFTDTGLKDPNVTTGVYNTAIYGEFGIHDRFTALINAPIFSRNVMKQFKIFCYKMKP